MILRFNSSRNNGDVGIVIEYNYMKCGCTMKRDFVGARNVFLKYASMML